MKMSHHDYSDQNDHGNYNFGGIVKKCAENCLKSTDTQESLHQGLC